MKERMIISYIIKYDRPYCNASGTAIILKTMDKTILVGCADMKFKLRLNELKDGAVFIRTGSRIYQAAHTHGAKLYGPYHVTLKVRIE